jgi:hypothetical protein
MPTMTLLATTAIACLLIASGCERPHEPRNPPSDPTQRATIMGAPSPVERTVDSVPISEPLPVSPEPGVTTPPNDDVLETPGSPSEPPPPGAAPGNPPSQYEDRCGRPLVA